MNQNMSSRHWMSASGVVQERAIWAGPMFAKHVIVPILIILIVIAPKVPYDMVIISNISYKIDSEGNGHNIVDSAVRVDAGGNPFGACFPFCKLETETELIQTDHGNKYCL